jgi:hypothetical protein
MRQENIFTRLKLVADVALTGAVTLSIAFGWMVPSVDLHAIGAILGATAASLKIFHVA